MELKDFRIGERYVTARGDEAICVFIGQKIAVIRADNGDERTIDAEVAKFFKLSPHRVRGWSYVYLRHGEWHMASVILPTEAKADEVARTLHWPYRLFEISQTVPREEADKIDE